MTHMEKEQSRMDGKDYYQLLSLNREGVTQEKVKKAFMAKALLWHPDKATSPKDVEIYTKVYEELQKAYKTLSNDELRHQYNAAQQTTAIDLIRQERDRYYERDDKYTTLTPDGYVFDREKFICDYTDKIKDEDKDLTPAALARGWTEQTKDYIPCTINQSHYENYLKEREKQDVAVLNIFPQEMIGKLDRNLFHETFDKVQSGLSQARGLQEASADPGAYDTEYDGSIIGDNFYGNLQQYTDVVKNLKFDHEPPAREYGADEGKLDISTINKRMEEIKEDRKILDNLKVGDFNTEPTEIEKLYASVFQNHMFRDICEGLEAPTNVKF